MKTAKRELNGSRTNMLKARSEWKKSALTRIESGNVTKDDLFCTRASFRKNGNALTFNDSAIERLLLGEAYSVELSAGRMSKADTTMLNTLAAAKAAGASAEILKAIEEAMAKGA